MSFKLKNLNGTFPPQGYKFTDPRTGMNFGDGDFHGVVRSIISHRRANPRLYPEHEFEHIDFSSVEIMLSEYTCARINNDARFCESADPIKLKPEDGAEIRVMDRACYKCGHERGYVGYCKTCAGRRHTNYICEKCFSPLGK